MDVKLSKDADYVICRIYETYLDSRQRGTTKDKAKYLGSSKSIAGRNLNDWQWADVDDTCRELGRAGLLEIMYADNMAYEVYLNDAAIIYMEGRFGNSIKKVLEYISLLKP